MTGNSQTIRKFVAEALRSAFQAVELLDPHEREELEQDFQSAGLIFSDIQRIEDIVRSKLIVTTN
jgi:hypothetical protein